MQIGGRALFVFQKLFRFDKRVFVSELLRLNAHMRTPTKQAQGDRQRGTNRTLATSGLWSVIVRRMDNLPR
jgi:hypothetical protein